MNPNAKILIRHGLQAIPLNSFVQRDVPETDVDIVARCCRKINQDAGGWGVAMLQYKLCAVERSECKVLKGRITCRTVRRKCGRGQKKTADDDTNDRHGIEVETLEMTSLQHHEQKLRLTIKIARTFFFKLSVEKNKLVSFVLKGRRA